MVWFEFPCKSPPHKLAITPTITTGKVMSVEIFIIGDVFSFVVVSSCIKEVDSLVFDVGGGFGGGIKPTSCFFSYTTITPFFFFFFFF